MGRIQSEALVPLGAVELRPDAPYFADFSRVCDDDEIRCDAKDGAVLLVERVEIAVGGATPGAVDERQVGEGCKPGTGDVPQVEVRVDKGVKEMER